MRIDKAIARAALLLAVLVLATACTSMDHYRERDPDPNHRLDALLGSYETALDEGEACLELWQVDSATIDCSRILREVERLYAEFPRNPRILMTNAVMNYELGEPEKAQFMLDELLGQHGGHPEAAILRSHIAIEEGNSRLARDVLEREITMAPSRADLREALAAAYYVEGKYDTARVVLGIAGRLGAPGWRLSYHHGLLCEAELNWEEACRFYNTALVQKSDYLPAQSRLIGLSQHKVCRDQAIQLSQLPVIDTTRVALNGPRIRPVPSTPESSADVNKPATGVYTARVAMNGPRPRPVPPAPESSADQGKTGAAVEISGYEANGDRR